MIYRRNYLSTRLSKNCDEIYADEVNAATGWLPVGQNQKVTILANKAMLKAKQNPNNPNVPTYYQIISVSGFPNGTVLFERKFGNEDDAEATPVAEFVQQAVHQTSDRMPPCFVRLRLTAIDTRVDPNGVFFGLQVSQFAEV